jgi:hypothetical protein
MDAPAAETPTLDARTVVEPVAAEAGCPFPHGTTAVDAGSVTVAAGESAAPAAPATVESAAPAVVDAKCPVPHGIATLAPGCPVPHGATTVRPVHRSKADNFVRRVLRIKERPAGVTHAAAYQAFQKSMLISATRCTLTYVIFPFVLPVVGIAAQGAVGIAVGLLAMVCDVFTIRRFFAVDHKYRWYFSGIVFGIMCLLTALLVQDISHLVTNSA